MKLSRITALISLLLCLSLISACQRSDGGVSASSAGGSGVDLSTPGSPSGSPASAPAPPPAGVVLHLDNKEEYSDSYEYDE